MSVSVRSLCSFGRLYLLPSPLTFRETDGFGSRGVYRTIELADGWSGRIISVERYFSESDPFSLPSRSADVHRSCSGRCYDPFLHARPQRFPPVPLTGKRSRDSREEKQFCYGCLDSPTKGPTLLHSLLFIRTSCYTIYHTLFPLSFPSGLCRTTVYRYVLTTTTILR